MFTPHNFHDRDASRASRQGARVDLKERNRTRYFGGRYEQDMTVKLVSGVSCSGCDGFFDAETQFFIFYFLCFGWLTCACARVIAE
jgi:hypothetical protein